MEYVREWVLSVLVLVVTAAFFEGIFPEGSMSRYLKYIFSDSSRRHFISCDTAAAVTVSGGKKTGNSVMIRRKVEYR